MSENSARKLFVNIPVHDLARSKEFFSSLGFSFNRQFTDDKAACMVVNDDACFMLLTESFFRTFSKRKTLFALSAGSRAEVDEIVRKAIDAGGSHAKDPVDEGFMYGWSFYDVDGHHWEILWMDPNAIQ